MALHLPSSEASLYRCASASAVHPCLLFYCDVAWFEHLDHRLLISDGNDHCRFRVQLLSAFCFARLRCTVRRPLFVVVSVYPCAGTTHMILPDTFSFSCRVGGYRGLNTVQRIIGLYIVDPAPITAKAARSKRRGSEKET